MPNPSCRYQVDANDKIIDIQGSWNTFAKANGGDTLLRSPILKQSIWTFIRGLSTTYIYQVLINQVRETKKSIRFPFRCDSAELLRYMEMEISPGKDDTIWFQTSLKRQINPNTLPRHSRLRPKPLPIVKMCAWCKSVWVRDSWITLTEAIWLQGLLDLPEVPPITHGICPDCKSLMEQEVKVYQATQSPY